MSNAVPIAPVGPTTAATMLFRENGNLHVAAIVKATFSFSHQAPMRVAQPEAIFTKEVHRLGNPTRSIVATSDLVPRLPAVDVLLLGQAYAPGGSAVHSRVRLTVGRGDSVLLDKTVNVFGDRKGSELKPFRTMPLVYEKTFGGPGYRDNPLGTGALAGDPPPNLVDPQIADRAAGFAPISRTWPARTSLAAPEVRAALDKPVAEIPPGFDLRYFHAAPPDQRLQHLLGDEWIVLEGVHAEHARLHLQLPGAQAMVRISGTEAEGRVFSLRADTLRIDADAERCTIVWRNSLRVRDAELGALRLLAGVALPDAPIEWPAHIEAPAAPDKHVVRSPQVHDAGGTILLEDSHTVAANFGGTMDITDEDIESVHIEMTVDDFSSTTVLGGTLVPLTSPLPVIRGAPAAPPAAPPPAPPAAAAKAPPNPKEGTLDLSNDFAAISRDVMPFAARPAAERNAPSGRVTGLPFGAAGRPPASSTPIPGSPSHAPVRGVVPGNEDSVTFDASNLDDEAQIDLSGTLPSPSSTMPAYVPPARALVTEAAPPPPRIDVQVGRGASHSKPTPPSIFAHQSPDSAPTHVRPLAPAAHSMDVALDPVASPPEPPPLSALNAPPVSSTVRLPERVEAAPIAEPPKPPPIAEPPRAAPPAPAAPPREAARELASPADPWGRDLNQEAPVAPQKAPAPTAVPAVNLRSNLYKRFKK